MLSHLRNQLAQREVKMTIMPRKLVQKVAAVIAIQAVWRSHSTRQRRGLVDILSRYRATIALQCGWRRCIARQRRQLLTLLQSTLVQLWSQELLVGTSHVEDSQGTALTHDNQSVINSTHTLAVSSTHISYQQHTTHQLSTAHTH